MQQDGLMSVYGNLFRGSSLRGRTETIVSQRCVRQHIHVTGSIRNASSESRVAIGRFDIQSSSERLKALMVPHFHLRANGCLVLSRYAVVQQLKGSGTCSSRSFLVTQIAPPRRVCPRRNYFRAHSSPTFWLASNSSNVGICWPLARARRWSAFAHHKHIELHLPVCFAAM